MKTMLFITDINGADLLLDWRLHRKLGQPALVEDEKVFIFPESVDGIPLTPLQLLDQMSEMVGHIIVTTSEIAFLWLSSEVRGGRIHPFDVVVYWHCGSGSNSGVSSDPFHRVEFDEEGEVINGASLRSKLGRRIFDWRADLLFGE